MTLRSSRTRLIVIAAIALGVVLVLWLRGGDDDARSGAVDPATAGAGAAAPDRSAPPGRTGPRRAIDDDDRFAGLGDVEVAITGQVIDATTRAGVAGVEVLFESAAGEASATSGNDGAFSLTLRPGAHQVRAVGELRFAPPRALTVGRVTALKVDVEVMPLARIRGRVIGGDGAPVAGATVTVAASGRELQRALDKDSITPAVQSQPDGGFELHAFPGADLVIADHQARGHGRARIEVPSSGGAIDGVEVRLEPYASLAGVVREPGGKAVAGATVSAAIRVPGTSVRQDLSVPSGADGRFLIAGVMPGKTVIDARADGYGPATPVEVRVAAGAQRGDLVMTLQASRRLVGRVLDGDGEPVYRARVKVDRHGSARDIHPVRTDVDGTFVVDGLDDGAHNVTVVIKGGGEVKATFDTLPSQPIELVLP